MIPLLKWLAGMIPDIAKRGSSFKGALAYYLHDKRQEGEQVRSTTERVAWTQTRNIGIDDPELAGRIMAATAMDSDRLKREAGVKRTGNKQAKPVYAFSLAWHPEEAGKIDKAEMLKAADEAIRALGAEDHQALIIAHTDRDHQHVHVVINGVSPIDGKMMSNSHDRDKLGAWALAYRVERGEEEKYCPARILKAKAAAATKRGEKVDFVRGEKSIPRSMIKHYQEARTTNQNSARSAAEYQKPLNAELMKKTRAQKASQAKSWTNLESRYKAKVADIKTQAGQAEARAREAVKRQFEGDRRTMAANQFQARADFEIEEATLGGKFRNLMDALKTRKVSGVTDEDMGWTSKVFAAMTKKGRADLLQRLHRAQRRDLTSAEREELGAAVRAVRDDKAALLSSARSGFSADRTALIERQAGERETIKRAWQARRREQARVFDTVKRDAAARKAAKARQTPKDEFKRDNTRAEHKAASEGRRRSRTRSRSRKRTRKDE